jgi:hypothetical protein
VMDEPICSGRVVKGDMQTAVQEYLRADGRSILLVGCAHLAEPDYFADLRKIVDEAEASGATVFMEGPSLRADDANVSDAERQAMHDSHDALNTQHRELTALLDLPWIYQGDSALAPYPSTWRSNDAREVDMCRLVGTNNMVDLAPSAAKYERFKILKETKGAESLPYITARTKYVQSYMWRFKERSKAAAVSLRMRFLIPRTTRSITRLFSRKPAPTGNGWMNPYVYTYRECVAVLTALDTDGNVVMLWSPGHLCGIGRILTRNGFEPQDPLWLTACHKVDVFPEKKPKATERRTANQKTRA